MGKIQNTIKTNKTTVYLSILFINILLLSFNEIYSQNYLIENKGQYADSILFYSVQSNFYLFILKDKIIYRDSNDDEFNVITFNDVIDRYKVEFNNYPYFNYFIGNDSQKWITKARTCSKIEFSNKNNIVYKLTTGDEISITAFSNVFISTIKYQLNKKKLLNTGETFTLKETTYNNDEKPYRRKLPEIQSINPKFYSSYFGGSSWDIAEDIAVDKNKNIYIVGNTESKDFPASDSAFQNKLRQGKIIYPDCFVAKFDSTGKNLIFATFLGSQLEDFAKSVAVDDSANIYLTGYLAPTGTFPYTSNAYDTTENGAYDSFVAKLSNDGSRLLASTYLGSENDDYALKIFLDNSGNVNICGFTKENDKFPITDNAIQKYHGGANDVFYCKLSKNIDSLLYSTYLGGLDDDFGEAIAIDRNNYVYLAGSTRSLNFPVSSDAFDDLYNDTLTNKRRSDGFVTIISPNGTLEYSTFFGGSNRDVIYDIEVDNNLSFYITGVTESKDFPVTAFAYDTTYRSKEGERSAGDIFVTKFLPTRKYLDFSTYIGGSSADKAYDIEIANDSYIYFIGATSSNDIDVSKNAFQKVFKDSSFGSDAILGIIEPPGNRLTYLSFFGGSKSDIIYSMELIDDEFFYFAGTTLSEDLPLSQSPYSSTFNNDTTSEAFFGILQPKILAVSAGGDKYGIIEACKGDIITLGSNDNIGIRGSATFTWYPSKGLSDNHGSQPTLQVSNEATYILHVIDSKGWEDWDTVYIKLLPVIDAKIYGPQYVFKNSVHSYGTVKNDFAKFKWFCIGGNIITPDTLSTINVKWGKDSIGYLVLITKNDIGCSDTSKHYLVYLGDIFKPRITVLTDSILCSGEKAILDAGYGYKSYNWSDGTTTRFDTVTNTGKYWVYVKDSANYQAVSDTIFIKFLPSPPKPKISFNYDSTVLSVDLFNMKYQWYHNGKPIPNANSRTYVPEKIGWYKCRIGWDTNECTTFSDSLELRFSNVKGFSKVKTKAEFYVYPNPSHTNINIICKNKILDIVDEIKIIDVFGRVVKSIKYFKLQETIDISNIQSGQYILYTKYKNHFYIQKISVIH